MHTGDRPRYARCMQAVCGGQAPVCKWYARLGPVPQPDRRRLILDSAIGVIARTGVRGLRVEAVAAEAGVAVSLIYYYFGSRKGLVRLGGFTRQDCQSAILRPRLRINVIRPFRHCYRRVNFSHTAEHENSTKKQHSTTTFPHNLTLPELKVCTRWALRRSYNNSSVPAVQP